MDQGDLYKDLEVSPEASAEEVRASYRRLARKFHPDVNPDPGAGERMKRINAAYDVLGDAVLRRRYDLERNWQPEPYDPPWDEEEDSWEDLWDEEDEPWDEESEAPWDVIWDDEVEAEEPHEPQPAAMPAGADALKRPPETLADKLPDWFGAIGATAGGLLWLSLSIASIVALVQGEPAAVSVVLWGAIFIILGNYLGEWIGQGCASVVRGLQGSGEEA
jgi:curved DNA-binding protein CbpA